MEKCESAILSLLRGIPGMPGPIITKVVLDNIDDSDLEPKLTAAFARVDGCSELDAKNYANERIRALEAIECYIAGEMGADLSEVDVESICTSTFAYSCLNDAGDKQRLVALFCAIGEKLSSDNAGLCALTRLGARKTESLRLWCCSEEGRNFISGNQADLLPLISSFIAIERPSGFQFTADQLNDIVTGWLDGLSITGILEALKNAYRFERRTPKISDIEKCLSNSIKYSMSHFISCVIDVATELNIDGVDLLASLQRMIRYGTRNLRCITICEEFFDDRFVARALLEVIGFEGDDTFSAVKKDLSRRADLAYEALSQFPQYLTEELKERMGS